MSAGTHHCVVCEGRLSPDAVHARTQEIPQAIAFHECETCGAMVAPAAAEIAAKLYEDRSSTNFAPGKSSQLRRLKAWLMKRTYVATLQRENVQFLVDFGCGNGDLANALADAVARVHAVDMPSQRPSGLDERVAYHSISEGGIPTSDGKAAYILRHVVEHFAQPVLEMKKLSAAMKAGDIAIIETPVVTSIFRQLMGDYWPGYFPPYHTFVPSEATFRSLAAQSGLEIVSVRKREPAIFGSYLHQKRGAVGNGARWAAAAALPLQWFLSRATGNSEAIEVTLRK